jgi:hypothetical protein
MEIQAANLIEKSNLQQLDNIKTTALPFLQLTRTKLENNGRSALY